MLQHLKYDLGDSFSKALYVTADHTYFYNHSLLDTATTWYQPFQTQHLGVGVETRYCPR